MGQILIGTHWNLAIYSKGSPTLHLPVWGTLGFSKGSGVQVQVMTWSFGSARELGGEWGFDSGCIWRSKFSPLHMLWLHDLRFWSVISEKQLSISLKRTGTFWDGSVVKTGSFFFRFYLFVFRQRGKEGEREGEKHQCVVASQAPPTGDLVHNPGMCPDRELNPQHFALKTRVQPTGPHQDHFFSVEFLVLYLL